MQNPEKPVVGFGSEVLRLETAAHRKHRRRRSYVGTWIGVLASVNLIYFGYASMQSGKWMAFRKSMTELPGWMVVFMGVVLLFFCAWQLLRLAAGKD